MKKIMAMCLACTLLLSVTACQKKQPSEQEEPTADVQSTTAAVTEETDPIMTVTQTYLSADMTKAIQEALSADPALLVPCEAASSFYAPQDLTAFAGKTVSSITVTVSKTAAADAQGNFTLTAAVFGSTETGMKSAPKRTYALRVSAKQHGLSENATVSTMITVDVSDLDLRLAEGETLGFYAAGDTLIPGYLNSDGNALRLMLCDQKPASLGCLTGVGSASMAVSLYTLPFDYTFTYTDKKSVLPTSAWESDDEYKQLAETFRKKFAGKTVSILGDSISTWGGISDYPKDQIELSGNATYYGASGGTNLQRLPSSEATWWGRLIRDAGLTLCINNSCSGASVYGVAGGTQNHQIPSVVRCQYLHTAQGKKPDLILFFMGTNDLGKPSGDLYERLQNRGTKTEKQVVEEWFDGMTALIDNGMRYEDAYKSFEQAYALTLLRMQRTYRSADVLCMGLMVNKTNSADKVARYNTCIRAIAAYFGALYVDPYANSGMNAENMHGFTVDANYIHPNAAGHYALTKNLMSSILTKK